MSQELFQKALAAKLAGDEEGFKTAVREAIIAKTKAILGESVKPVVESSFWPMNKNSKIEQVADKSFFFHGPIAVPEGAVPDLPAGQYSAVVDVDVDHDPDSVWAYATQVQIYPVDDDQLLATIQGQAASDFAEQYLQGFESVHDYIVDKYEANIRDQDAERDWEARNDAW